MCLIAYNKHGSYSIPPDSLHRKAVEKIVNGKVHEPKTIRMINSYCGDGEVVHAGAYFGDMLPALKKCKRVWAFEPNFESYSCALETIELNDLKNIELINSALGEKQGKAWLKTEINGEKWGGGCRIHEDGEFEVDVVTIDWVVDYKRVTVIHLDVEGYEVEALKGGIKAIEAWYPVLILERNNCIYGHWFQENIIDRLGYKWKRNIHGNAVFKV